jgi:hypothetical protein
LSFVAALIQSLLVSGSNGASVDVDVDIDVDVVTVKNPEGGHCRHRSYLFCDARPRPNIGLLVHPVENRPREIM